MTINYTKSFRRDCKVLRKRSWDVEKLDDFLNNLILEKNGHMLKGHFKGKKECHVGFDWIVIYELSSDAIKLLRTGTHSEILGD
ncbi:MAG: type II toxin-antitoxin system YafQ family toxin [Acholeplasmataceae bacterium]|nr:type II toxin-antitoxin system YafQ family toxin [Acholeplasmataceae bacterium]